MKHYTRFMNWAVVSFISRDTQDDHKDKLHIAGLFETPAVAEDSFVPHLPNKEIRRYIVHVDDLEDFEKFYNLLNDNNLNPSDCWKLEFTGIEKKQKEKFITILSR